VLLEVYKPLRVRAELDMFAMVAPVCLLLCFLMRWCLGIFVKGVTTALRGQEFIVHVQLVRIPMPKG